MPAMFIANTVAILVTAVAFAVYIGAPPRLPAANVTLLVMVRDGAASLPALLNSVETHVSAAVFCDTGSVDDTLAVIAQWADNTPTVTVTAVRHNWTHSFSANRNLCAHEARTLAPYTQYFLWMDADDTLSVWSMAWRQHIPHAGANLVLMDHDTVRWYSPRLVSATAAGLKYQCAIHEYIAFPGNASGVFPLVSITNHGMGASGTERLERNLRYLRAELELGSEHHCHSRDLFYLGNTLYEMGNLREAALAYASRIAAPGGFEEERYYAHYRYAECMRGLGQPASSVAGIYVAAWQRRPWRGEALYALAMMYTAHEQYYACTMVFDTLARLPYPSRDLLFIDPRVHGYAVPMNAGVCAYRTGNIEAARRLWKTARDIAPPSAHAQLNTNIAFTR